MKKQKKQRNYILLAFLIPIIIAMLFSCSGMQKSGYGCPHKPFKAFKS